jgi:predicted transcriptional regulator
VVLLAKYRDRLSLVAAILDAAGRSSTKTHVMKMANLSYKLLEKYLADALSMGFVQQIGSKYSLTTQGRDFLKRYKRMQDQYFRVQEVLSEIMHEREILERMCIQNEPADVLSLQRANC